MVVGRRQNPSVIVDTTVLTAWLAHPARREWVTELMGVITDAEGLIIVPELVYGRTAMQVARDAPRRAGDLVEVAWQHGIFRIAKLYPDDVTAVANIVHNMAIPYAEAHACVVAARERFPVATFEPEPLIEVLDRSLVLDLNHPGR
jgi:hypothetical protein